jgi:hypothetical protein
LTKNTKINKKGGKKWPCDILAQTTNTLARKMVIALNATGKLPQTAIVTVAGITAHNNQPSMNTAIFFPLLNLKNRPKMKEKIQIKNKQLN